MWKNRLEAELTFRGLHITIICRPSSTTRGFEILMQERLTGVPPDPRQFSLVEHIADEGEAQERFTELLRDAITNHIDFQFPERVTPLAARIVDEALQGDAWQVVDA